MIEQVLRGDIDLEANALVLGASLTLTSEHVAGARAPADSLHFIDHRAVTLTREELLNDVWGYHAMPSTRTVVVHVAWLRQKIEPNSRHPQYILTIHGMGYKFAG